jgi:cystathionine beta-lyase
MQYDFDKIIDRSHTHSFKWGLCEKKMGSNGLPMWVADMDFEAPREVTDALVRRSEHGIFGYTLRPESYDAALINWLKKRHNWDIKREWILTTPGVLPAVSIALLAFTCPGDSVVIQSPVYHPFKPLIQGNGRKVIENQLKLVNGKYGMDFEALEHILANDKQIKLMILCSPHNPVGRVWEKAELERLADICIKHNILILADEIHSDLIMNGHTHTPLAGISQEIAGQVITCTSASKTFNLAGLACANIIISDKTLYDKFKNMSDNLQISLPNLFGIAATEAAYTYGQEWLERLLVYLNANYEFMVDYLKTVVPQINVTPLEGTYLAWLDFRKFGLDDIRLDTLLQNQAGVWLNSGPSFGSGGLGFQRLNIACPRKILQEGLSRIAVAVNHT